MLTAAITRRSGGGAEVKQAASVAIPPRAGDRARRADRAPADHPAGARARRDLTRVPISGPQHGALRPVGQRLGIDVGGVGLRTLPATSGVSGETRGETILLAARRGPVAAAERRRLIAHELAHVEQHRNALLGRPLASDAAAETEARLVAGRVALDGHARVRLAASPAVTRRSLLSDTVAHGATPGQVFDALRAATAAERADPAVATEATKRFAAMPDDLWLAQTLIALGPEPLWPAATIDERTTRAVKNSWAAEAGNVAADIVDPDPDPAGPTIAPIRAYFFPGRDTGERALIVGGVHGTEPSGIEVVERLRTQLAAESAAANPPKFATILVPTLIARTARPGKTNKQGHFDPGPGGGRNLPTGTSRAVASKGGVEPNRNFPFPGTTYADARKRGAGGGAELQTLPSAPKTGSPVYGSAKKAPGGDPRTTTRMLPETRALIALLERFKPTRIVTVHAHGLGKRVGDAPGVFVDPRGTDPNTGAKTDPSAESADIALTQSLLAKARGATPKGIGGPAFAGNAPASGTTPNVLYATTAHVEGNSLGMYGPVKTAVRPAATTITVEVPQVGTGVAPGADFDALLDAHRDAIDQIILR